MTNPKHLTYLHVLTSYEMKKELEKIAKERNMSVAKLVRHWLAGCIKYWRDK